MVSLPVVRGLILPLVAVLCILGACQRDPEPWHVVDLWAAPGELRGEAGHWARFRGNRRTHGGPTAKAVNHTPRQQVVFHLSLGRDAAFTFRPNPVGGACRFDVRVRPDGAPEASLLSKEVEPRPPAPGMEVRGNLLEQETVDLARYADQRVELVLAAGGESCRTAQWVSPIVTYRGSRIEAEPAGRPNVILVTADTLRADAVGAWGRTPSVTPALDRLAETSDVFLEAYSTSNNTNPSFISLMTGLYPRDHGIFDLTTPLPASIRTLAELLAGAGYETHGVVSVNHLGQFSGLGRGFDELLWPEAQFFAETAVNLAMGQIDASTEPFFSWIHLFDPHTPQSPPSPYHLGYRPAQLYGLGAVESWITFRDPGPRSYAPVPRQGLLGHSDLYPGEVAYLDREVDRLLAFLRSRGLLERSIVVFVADHGENLEERGRELAFDHHGLWDTTVHVPLLVHWPGQQRGRRIHALVQHLDLFTTLLGAAGVEAPAAADGLDLRRIAEGDRGRPAVFAHHANDHGEMVRTARFKYYRQRVPEFVAAGEYFYDLEQDPAELRNLAGTGHDQEERLKIVLDRWLASGRPRPPSRPVDLSTKERRQLEALGYLQ